MSHEDHSAGLRITLLGGFSVTVNGQVVNTTAWKRRKAAAIVKILALAPCHRLHREQVMELLWPELDPAQAANSLHQTLHAARRALASNQSHDEQSLILRDQIVQFNPDIPIWVDAIAFEETAAVARQRRDPLAYQFAIDLYTGNLLPDDRYEPWASDQREALRQQYIALLTELADIQEKSGDDSNAIATACRIVTADPLDEPAHRALMRLYARSGQRQHAIRQYQTLRDALRDELGVDPEPETETLVERIRDGSIAGQPPRVKPPSHTQRHNLPAAISSFIGREREKSEVRRLLAGARLLTLTGPGGCGKTRLSLETASDVLDEFPDGVWLVELAAISDPTLIPQAVAAALDVRETPGQPLLDTLVAWLRERRLLLVLDNCEHLVDSAARLVEALLHASPGLRVLATSREPLRIAGETTWLVPSLSLPNPGDDADPEQLIAFEAVQLFVDRAGRIAPGFVVTPETAAAVAELCYRLDGIPLAIELAAARVRVLSAGQIVERLSDRFQLLSGGNRVALSRQQTLRATLDWSYDLLSEPERSLFARLSVFSGSFDLTAAEQVCAGSGLEQSAILDLLTQLVDRSLVVAGEESGFGAIRYHLLETMREYAGERLTERGDVDTVRHAHARHFAAFATDADRHMRGSEQRKWLRRLDREHDNLRAALDWCWRQAIAGQPEQAEAGLALAGTLHWFWQLGGHFSEGRAWLDRLLTATPSSGTRTRGRGMALTAAGVLSLALGEYGPAQASLDESIAIWRERDETDGLALAVTWSGWNELFHGRLAEARARHREGLDLFTLACDSWGIALATIGLGFDAAESDEHADAAELFERSLAMFRDLQDDWGIATTLHQLAYLTYRRGDFATARERVAEALTLGQQMGDVWLEIQSRGLIGEIARAEGDYDAATAAAEVSLALAREIGHHATIAWSLRDAGFVALNRRDARRALAHFRDSLSIFQSREYRLGEACCLIGLAGVAADRNQAEIAARLLGAAQSMLDGLGLSLAPADRRESEQITATVRATLGDTAFDAAWTAGRQPTLDADIAALEQRL